MRIFSFVALLLLIAVVHAGLFGEDVDVAKRRKRQEKDKEQKRSGKKKQKQEKKEPEQGYLWNDPVEPEQEQNLQQDLQGDLQGDLQEDLQEDLQIPITNEEIIVAIADQEIIDTVTGTDDPELQNEDIYKIWEQNMHDFVPEDLTNFLVDSSSATVFYEDIGHESPTTIKGAYYVHGGKEARAINVFVQDPHKNILYKRSDEIQGIMVFDTTVPGQYAFIFSNLDDSTQKTVTFAIHTYEEKQEQIQYEIDDSGERVVVFDPNPTPAEQELEEEMELAGDAEIGQVRNLLRGIQTASKQIQTECIMSFHRQDAINIETYWNGQWYLWAMLIEVVLFVAILAFQTHHMKTKLDNKLIM